MRKIFKKFSSADFNFLADTLYDDTRKRRHFLDYIQKDLPALDQILNQEKLIQQVALQDNLFIRISPYLYFEILLRRSLGDIQRENYILENVGYLNKKIPVFDQQKVLEVLSPEMVKDYLVELLVSFIRVNNFTIYVRRGKGVYFKKTISDFDLDLLTEAAKEVEEPYRFLFLRRAGDIALFISGIFPENLFGVPEKTNYSSRSRWIPHWVNRSEDLEKIGKTLYQQASESSVAREYSLDSVLQFLSDNFPFTKKPLNVMSDRYLCFHKYDIFQFLSN